MKIRNLLLFALLTLFIFASCSEKKDTKTNGIVIQKIGSYDLYAGRWSKLRAVYSPLIYEANDPLNVTFEWQIPNSAIRNYADTAYKDVKPFNSGQLNIGVRAICECGNGEWQYRLFDVGGGNNTGPIELIPADGN